jgi:hypothetical protein
MAYETYYDRYKGLCETYKIRRGTYGLISKEDTEGKTLKEVEAMLNEAIKQYDVVVERCGSVYAGAKYKVLRNEPKLSNRDLAIICDDGSLCFGYRTEGGYIVVYTD